MAKTVYTSERQIDRLRVYNIVAGSLHLLQAIGFAIVLTINVLASPGTPTSRQCPPVKIAARI